ncbi:MAG TPA: DUF72 domain-containing protein [Pyrinomonadaceae bacterium]|jgi:uncharacterized protein YecE (DUF72 family)|nr:DUF72 domain-containing protein [Pyrinomonadaceae bacterium]
MRTLIGTSGFGIGRVKYFQLFSCVEVQHTFYQPPAIKTLARWREAAPPDFEFVLKAWQLITHDAKSPTYRRLKKKLSETEKQEAGYFRPTGVVEEAWEITLACANALQATTILFQCPASFKQTGENLANLRKFFANIKRHQVDENGRKKSRVFNLCWEPRGEWDPKVVKSICDELKLWHVVDPFVNQSVTPDRLYYRLHGRSGWRYEYDEPELRELASMLATDTKKKKARGGNAAYIFFNNVSMIQDAARFQLIVEGKVHPD